MTIAIGFARGCLLCVVPDRATGLSSRPHAWSRLKSWPGKGRFRTSCGNGLPWSCSCLNNRWCPTLRRHSGCSSIRVRYAVGDTVGDNRVAPVGTAWGWEGQARLASNVAARVIELSDTDLRLVSVRPNRPSLRGAYGLFDQRLRRGGSEYTFGLNAVQSTPAGSYLVFTFRAVGAAEAAADGGGRVDGPGWGSA